MALIKRSQKGLSLTYAEMDANFTHLGGDGSYQFPATDGTANQVLATDGNGQLTFADPSAGALPDLTDVTIDSGTLASGQVLKYNGSAWVNGVDVDTGILYTDLSIGAEQAASGDGGIGYDNTTGVFTYAPPDLSSYLTTVAFSDLTGKPTTISGYGITDAFDGAFASLSGKPTTISGYGITDAFDGATSSLTGNIDLATQVTGTLPVSNMAATALTTVQTATDETAQLALTAEEGDVVVRTDENKTYMHNGGSAGTMADYTLLATPTDAVTSVDGNTGAVTTLQLGTTSTTALAGNTTFAFADITSKPTTIAGYGITDALALGTSSTTALAGDTTFAFADITSKPTTISGYGITDALAIGTSNTTAMAGDTTFAFADITSKPTTISGYGITDAFDGAFSSLSSKPTTISGYGITDAFDGAFSSLSSKPTTISGYGITDAFDGAFSSLSSKPTTISGYGITDAFDGAFSSLSSKPTTIAGYGITDAFDGAFSSLSSKPTTIAGYGITDALALGTSSTTALAGNTTFALNDLSDVNTANAINGSVLKYVSGVGWVVSTDTDTGIELTDLSVVHSAYPSSLGGLSYDNSTGVFTHSSQYNLFPPTAAQAQDIGLSTATGDIRLGFSTKTQTISINSENLDSGNNKTVKIANGSGTRTVYIAGDNHTGATTTIYVGNPSGTATSNTMLQGTTNFSCAPQGDGAPEVYSIFDHQGNNPLSQTVGGGTNSDGDYDISGTGLNPLAYFTVPAKASGLGPGKRAIINASCMVETYNTSSSSTVNFQGYMGVQIKSKGTEMSQNLGPGTLVSSPTYYSAVWTFAGNVTDKIISGFGMVGNSATATGMTYGGAPISLAVYDKATNKTYLRVNSYYHYNSLGGSVLSNGQTTSFDVWYSPTDFASSGSWVSGMRADNTNDRINVHIPSLNRWQMYVPFNMTIPKQSTATEMRFIFDHYVTTTNMLTSVKNFEGTIQLLGSAS